MALFFLCWMLVGMYVAKLYDDKYDIVTVSNVSFDIFIGDMMFFFFMSAIWPYTLFKILYNK